MYVKYRKTHLKPLSESNLPVVDDRIAQPDDTGLDDDFALLSASDIPACPPDIMQAAGSDQSDRQTVDRGWRLGWLAARMGADAVRVVWEAVEEGAEIARFERDGAIGAL